MKKQKMRRVGGFLFFLLLTGVFNAKAQTELRVYYQNATEQLFSLDENGKIYFNDAEMFISNGEQLLSTIQISDIQKIVVREDEANSIADHEDNLQVEVIVYPNPARDYIRIKSSLKEKTTLTLYAMNGQILINREYYPDDLVDISHLSAGLYIVKVGNITKKISKL